MKMPTGVGWVFDSSKIRCMTQRICEVAGFLGQICIDGVDDEMLVEFKVGNNGK